MIPALTGLLAVAKLIPKVVQALKSVLAAAPADPGVSDAKPGACIKVTFDDLWRPVSTTNALDTFNMSYLGKTGQVTGVNSTSGPSMAYAYGTNAQDRRLTQIKNLGRSGSALSQFDFQYDAVGQITQITDTVGTATNSTGGGGDCHDKCCHKGKCCHKDRCCKKKCCKGKGECGKERCHQKHDRDDDDDRFGAAPFDLRLLNGLLGLGIASLWGGLLWQFARRPRTTTSRLAQVTSLALVSALALNGCIFSGGGTTSTTTNVYNFTYDNLGQLVGVKLNQTQLESYVFDKSGNLTSLTTGSGTSSFSYNSLNQPTSPAGKSFDAKGQTTTDGTRTYEWDDQGRITAIVQGTQRTELGYDGMSRRTKITELTNGTVTSKKLYFWLGGSIVCERDGLQTGFPLTKRYFDAGEVRGTTKLYYATDHLGSIRELVDSTGAVRAEYSYSTYGEQTKSSGDLECDWAWAGLWNHKPSGLYLATYRAYDAANKRWISRDPLGEGVDYNLYRYCGNSPINAVDPRGLYVEMTFNSQTGTLTAQDYHSNGTPNGSPVVVPDAFSGNGPMRNNHQFDNVPNHGPVPEGDYIIGPGSWHKEGHGAPDSTGNWQWFPLDRIGPLRLKDEKGQPVQRGEFFLHPGVVSNGCVTLKSKVPKGEKNYPGSPDYDKLQHMLENTEPYPWQSEDLRPSALGVMHVH